ncbi:MAG: hypothetical protein U5K69_25445 [Balneolaceae bacterium]|nr:hypothetical protein [Balneolaceae bacterium]
MLDNPLIVVVLNNGGGNIFRMLPIHQHKEQYTRYFETPQQASFEHLANMHSLPYRSIKTTKQLGDLSLQTISSPGIHIVECKTNSDASMQLRNELEFYGTRRIRWKK